MQRNLKTTMARAVLALSLAGVIAGTASATIFVPPTPALPAGPAPVRQAAADLVQLAPAPKIDTGRAPVPMVNLPKRSPVRTVAPADEPPEAPTEPTEMKGLSEAEAKAAIERDGYKGVRALAPGANGRWTARVLRGRSEIGVTVEPDGSVRAE